MQAYAPSARHEGHAATKHWIKLWIRTHNLTGAFTLTRPITRPVIITQYEQSAWKAPTSVCTRLHSVPIAALLLPCFKYKQVSGFGICGAVRCHVNSNLVAIIRFQSYLGCWCGSLHDFSLNSCIISSASHLAARFGSSPPA